MKRWVLFIVTLLLISTIGLAQTVVTPAGQATTQGAAVPTAPMVSPPLVTTPIMHLGNAPTTNFGTSTAAVTMQSGQAEPPSGVPIRPEISYGPEVVYVGPSTTATNSGSSSTAAANSRPMMDLGVNSGAAVTVTDGTNGRSLGEIARENRQHLQGVNARTFTNSDVDRIAGAGGVSGVATNPANTTYPANNGVISSPGAVATTTTPTATEQNVPPATPTATEQKPSAATAPHEMAQAQTPANPADQNAQSRAADNSEQRTLPKSASPLPLIALVGLGAIATGLIVRRARA